jgi:CheY-like chemotaxis protein
MQQEFINDGLPDTNGYELVRRMRLLPETATSTVAVTGYGKQADRDKALQAGFDRHISQARVIDDIGEHGMRSQA